MTNQLIKAGTIITRFNHDLQDLYDEKEIMQFLYLLFQYRLGWNKAALHINKEKIIPDETAAWLIRAFEDLARQRPVQYITGETEFLGCRILVNPSVLIPRPETEELVSMIISDLKTKGHASFSILDIGTGSGCIAIAMKKHFPESTIHGCDNSEESLTVASENAAGNHCEISFPFSDILDPSGWNHLPKVNLIVSNPPYVCESEKVLIKENVLGYEPASALFIPDDDPLKFYKAIASFALSHLIKPGTLYLEINERFGSEIKELLENDGFSDTQIIQDINGKDRFIRAKLNIEH